jgi:hypothetical protein
VLLQHNGMAAFNNRSAKLKKPSSCPLVILNLFQDDDMLVQHHDMLAQHNVKAVFNNGSAKLKIPSS